MAQSEDYSLVASSIYSGGPVASTSSGSSASSAPQEDYTQLASALYLGDGGAQSTGNVLRPPTLSVQFAALPTPKPQSDRADVLVARLATLAPSVKAGRVKAPAKAAIAEVSAVAPTLHHIPFSPYPILLDGSGKPLAVLDKAYDYSIQDQLLSDDAGQEIVTFTVPLDDKARLIQNEMTLRVLNRDYAVRVVDDHLTQEGLMVRTITAEATWYDIQFLPPVQPATWVNQTASAILADLLKDSGWSAGTVEPQQTAGFVISEPTNLLACLRQLAATFGAELYFDTRGRTVSLVMEVGQDRRDVLLARGKNVQELLRREDTRQLVTRLYPYGKDKLTVSSVNGGREYIEDYSYFDARGLPRKVIAQVWQNDSYTEPLALLQRAQVELERLSQPTYSYTVAGVLDIVLSLGDRVQVYDPDIGLHETFRVSQRNWYPLEPWRTTMQLDTPLSLLASQLLGTQTADSTFENTSQAAFAQATNGVALTLGVSPQTVVTLPFSTLSITDAEFHFTVIAQASASAVVTTMLELNGQQIGPVFRHAVVPGWNTLTASVVLQSIPQTSGFLTLVQGVSAGQLDRKSVV